MQTRNATGSIKDIMQHRKINASVTIIDIIQHRNDIVSVTIAGVSMMTSLH